MTLPLTWKPRCVEIMSTNSVAMSTLEFSRVFCWMVPKPAVPAVPAMMSPASGVAENRFWPSRCRLYSLVKRYSPIWSRTWFWLLV